VNAESDANADGATDGADFLIWQQNLSPAPVAAVAAIVPEPATLGMAVAGTALLLAAIRRR
jgi:hypothetical protein